MSTIESVRIQHFRSIVDSGWVPIDDQITTLVGPNEAGKSNFLKAIRKFSSKNLFNEDDLCFYDHDNPDPAEPIPMVTLRIATTDLNNLHVYRGYNKDPNEDAFPTGPLTIQVTKFYSNFYRCNIIGHEELLSEYRFIRYSRLAEAISDIESTVRRVSRNEDSKRLQGLRIAPKDRHLLNEINSKGETNNPSEAEDLLQSYQQNLSDLFSGELDDSLEEFREQIKESYYRFRRYFRSVDQQIASNFVNITHIENLNLIKDEASISQLSSDNKEDEPYFHLLKFSDLSPSILDGISPRKQHNRRRKAATELSNRFNKAWDQDDISFNIEIGRDTISLLISDSTGSYDTPDHRSEGFRRYLSLFIALISRSGKPYSDTLLLLDDLGTHLHPDAQKDLLQALETLSEDNQIIYGTHSPFLINKDETSRIRLVDRAGPNHETRILSKLSQHEESGRDTFAPIRAVIGATFADSLFANKRNILVEGEIDELLLMKFSQLFENNGEDSVINNETTSIVNVSGAAKMDYYSKIMEAEDYDYVILLDSDSEGDQRKQILMEEEGIPEERIHQLADSVEELEDYKGEIEDVVTPDLYFKAVLEAHNDINESDLEEIDDASERNTVNALNHRLGQKMGGIRKKDVAEELGDIVLSGDSSVDDQTKENFRVLIKNLNSKLDSIRTSPAEPTSS